MGSGKSRLDIVRRANIGRRRLTGDAGTALLRDPENRPYEATLADIDEIWRRGGVIASWLPNLTAVVLLERPDLATAAGRLRDSGKGRWAIAAMIDGSVLDLSAVPHQRFGSRHENDSADRLSSARHDRFGGREEKAGAGKGEPA